MLMLLFIAAILLALGAMLYSLAKSGPQETLGGLLVTFGTVALALAGVLWKLGL